MIDYKEHQLSNGLRVLANYDECSVMAAVNLLYEVGSRDEEPSKTGFAHLFEHLMFRGTKSVPDFDVPVEEVAGENNAFTSADYTNYYITTPKDNYETALWLEADRMMGLNITAEKLALEKSVVIEEFNQRFLNRPYGEQWHTLREMVYTVHPYRSPVIGLTPDHIRDASLEDVRAFYERYYNPSNAILSVSGNIPAEQIFEAAERYFGSLPALPRPTRNTSLTEPAITAPRRKVIEAAVPANQITIAFLMGSRGTRDYYLCDLLTDLLAGGESARIYQHLVRERQIFSAANAYITGEMDKGLLILTGQLNPSTSFEEAEEALYGELRRLVEEPVGDYELRKVQNKFEANITFGELNVMNKAMNLGYYRMLGDMSLLNGEVDIFRSITSEEIASYIKDNLNPHQSATLIYKKK
ncbi:MAG: insulinase family protein [Tidjanibacter sp.]|nr:insulinase family protein [Tidjanibacter sp.]